MKTGFFSKIAVENLRKNARLYIPRVLAEAGLLGCFYILLTLALDNRLSEALGGSYLKIFMDGYSYYRVAVIYSHIIH